MRPVDSSILHGLPPGSHRFQSNLNYPMKKLLLPLLAAALLSLGTATASASDTAPKSVIHVVSVKWKADATKEQIKAALDGVHALPAAFKGITRVWTNAVKVQGEWSHVFVMEFTDEAALKAYAGSDAQKEWYKVYMPVRERSNTHDITN
jgi:hypothetical protein